MPDTHQLDRQPQGIAPVHPESLLGAIGQPLRRKEDARLLTGQGRFTNDQSLPGQAYAAMVRSPHPHARIVAIDAAAALALPGVLAVYTGAEIAADQLRPIPHNPVPSTRYDMKLTAPGGGPVFIGPHPLLPTDRARHVGEAVAMVVADTLAHAQDGAEAVMVDYEILPWVALSTDAIAPGAPALYDEAPTNVLVDSRFGDAEATDRAFADADHVVTLSYPIARVTGVPMEPRAALGHYDPATERYTLYAGGGGAVRQKAEMAEVLGVAPDRLRVLSLDVGGNFGTRNRVYVEFALTLWASRKIGRPVKFTATRSEAFLTDYQGRDLVTEVAMALDRHGRFLAMRASNLSNVGAHCVSLSPLSKGCGLITGSYHIPVATLRARAVFSNTMPTSAYRSSGRPEVTFAIERLIDKAARELGFDRVELRRMNLVPADAFPYDTAVGSQYDSGTYEANMDAAMRLADWDGIAKRRAEAASRGMLLGVGLANYVESSIGSPRERAEITVHPDGMIDVVIGTQPSGQGHETSFAQVVSSLLAHPAERIRIILGDTDIVSIGGGSHSGRSMRHAATVIAKGTGLLITKAQAIVAGILNVPADTVAFTGGRFLTPLSNRSFDFAELAQEMRALGMTDALAMAANNEMHEPVFPNGTAICEGEVDPDTGVFHITRYSTVDDVGRCINPMIVHGQTHGGIAQGVGQALCEQCVIDPGSGQPLSGSFQDYGMPHADTLPTFRSEIAEVLSPTNPFGIKAGGEGGTTPALAAVVSAVSDALSGLGVHDIMMPATPLAIWEAIQAVKAKGVAA